MAPKGGSNFGSFNNQTEFDPQKFKPIRAEFLKGSSPNSINRVSRESTWARWRRGYELAAATSYTSSFDYKFTYQIPVPSGNPFYTNPNPTVSGFFKGFPTNNKEFGMHWAGVRVAGGLRMDNLTDHLGTKLSIKLITTDNSYVYVTLDGDWSVANPLPPPLYVKIPGSPVGLKAINGEILEDRIITAGGDIITPDTINPQTQKRYGYTQYVLVDTLPFAGVLKLRRLGSVAITPDKEYITPANTTPAIGRFLITGSRYCCSCQDFNQRDYAFMTNLDNKKNTYFPVTKVASLKPGRYEVMTLSGQVDNNTMTSAKVNRAMDVIAPGAQFLLPKTVAENSQVQLNAGRDNPGVYRDFGYIYTRSTSDPSIQGANADGIPNYDDYSASNNNLVTVSDYWTPLLDEKRYCKHIYAMKFIEGINPPEPSDIPVEPDSIAEWEQKLVTDLEKQDRGLLYEQMRQSIGAMDVPPYNCQAPMMMPMLQKLFNVPSNLIVMDGFTMFDKNDTPYKPSQGGMPSPE